MEKDQKNNSDLQDNDNEAINAEELSNDLKAETPENKEKTTEITPEEKIIELEDKVVRAFAEMENQRRRFEKEKEDAFNYGGFSVAKETLNLITQIFAFDGA